MQGTQPGGAGNPKSETNSKRWKFPKSKKKNWEFLRGCEQFRLLQCEWRLGSTLSGLTAIFGIVNPG
jgi:hypothetical protein